MWRRCLVPLMSQDMNKTDQKERWKFVLEKFSHAAAGVGKRNIAHLGVEPQLLEMPECKRGKFVSDPTDKNSVKTSKSSKAGKVPSSDEVSLIPETSSPAGVLPQPSSVAHPLVEEDITMYTSISVCTVLITR